MMFDPIYSASLLARLNLRVRLLKRTAALWLNAVTAAVKHMSHSIAYCQAGGQRGGAAQTARQEQQQPGPVRGHGALPPPLAALLAWLPCVRPWSLVMQRCAEAF
jgi:hypothetical protein